ncbi:conserved hypothetical protein [Halobacteriovorax marinus SJ]|uniref:Secreted protein n=1 Tax=Halobacteriovorax marinus (strain ATCC BAA-682 / DSM 15412 / SJ) TaxID=862908 RepID=E1X1H1_HALMS|nr:hypothetical protein [Halobacteriovorax marinus]CBW26562.1 conserved hypothetical protein [Halobacteriovorax marinus SJ]
MNLKALGLLILMAAPTFVSAKSANIWSSIPFIRGADLCQYQQAYSQTRSEYMHDMTSMASELMQAGAKGKEALDMLLAFDALYDKNLRLAMQYKYMDVTLENTLKSYLDSYYTSYPVRDRKVRFRHMNDIRSVIRAINNNQRIGNMPADSYELVDYIAYGSYSLAPNCNGNIQVTITLVGSDGFTKNFAGLGKPSVVMSQIASRIFEEFERTKFPTTLNFNGRTITLLGSPNGSVGETFNPNDAARTCRYMGGRLPNSNELEMISAYGDWNGGIGIGRSVWAISSGSEALVYHPGLRNPSPVRRMSEVNTRKFKYYCIK